MPKYRVTVKYGKPGEYKNASTDVTVEADNQSTAMQLAINKFKNSNPANRSKEVDAVSIKEV